MTEQSERREIELACLLAEVLDDKLYCVDGMTAENIEKAIDWRDGDDLKAWLSRQPFDLLPDRLRFLLKADEGEK